MREKKTKLTNNIEIGPPGRCDGNDESLQRETRTPALYITSTDGPSALRRSCSKNRRLFVGSPSALLPGSSHEKFKTLTVLDTESTAVVLLLTLGESVCVIF